MILNGVKPPTDFNKLVLGQPKPEYLLSTSDHKPYNVRAHAQFPFDTWCFIPPSSNAQFTR